ncbi:hypothetical protein [Burkholderia sp. AU15512]|uniref:hypothetical protein n=1 Tax=Burkholderia sp. AU15512 TaxID=2015345 RepID=UPI00117F419E|nr:hypothetical protein [Burkholderia sp. AU15512]
MFSLLLIDDTTKFLDELASDLGKLFNEDEVEIRTWEPTKDEANSLDVFDRLVDDNTILVVTDYDLTSKGRTGLFGSSIVGWCQARAIPVGDYSRGNNNSLPKEPNLFELRVPTDPEESAKYIASVYRGFKWIRERLAANPIILEKGSPSAVLAELLDVPDLEDQFGLYGGRFGTANGALLDRIMRTAPDDIEPSDEERKSLLGYIVGHLLLNSVLRFSGPILSSNALAAYVASSDSEIGELRKVFSEAAYSGPFSELDHFFWLWKVDELLEGFASGLAADFSADTHGELNRAAVEVKLGRPLALHGCSRCSGKNGGFWCPFTRRVVCQKGECSVGSNSWIPRGARLCRVERDFYDEWAPILGI